MRLRDSHPGPLAIAAPVAALLLIALGPRPAAAQTLDIPWSTIDSGGGASSGGAYALAGTIGQPDADGAFTGGSYSLSGGFWPAAAAAPACIADFNNNGLVTIEDIFVYLAAWFAGDVRTDVDGSPGITIADIFKFLSLWFRGCP